VLNRVTKTTLPGSGRVTTATHLKGVTTVTDPNTYVTKNYTDSFGQIWKVVDAATSPTIYDYDQAGQLKTLTDVGGNVTTMTYDMMGQKRSIVDPDTGTTTYDAYDGAGNLKHSTAEGGVITVWVYDELGRRLSESAGGITHNWSYDTAPNGIGRLATQTDEAGQFEVLDYGLRGEVERKKFVINGKRLEFQSTFDLLGGVSTTTYPTGRIIERERDALGFLTGVRTQGGAYYASDIASEASGAPISWTLGNGVESSASFVATTGRVDKLELKSGGSVLDSATYGFDVGDRLTGITGTLGNYSFGYDSLDRLKQAIGPYSFSGPGVPVSKTLQYGYDALGNMTCRAATDRTNCSSTGGTELIYPAPGPGVVRPHAPLQVDGANVSYSPVGNLEGLSGRAYGFDVFERMDDVWQDGVVLSEFVHDANGQMAKITDRTRPIPSVRHLLGNGFEWDETRNLARTHVTVGGARLATQTEPFTPPAEGAAAFVPARRGTPLDPFWGSVAFASPALLAALLLASLLLRRRAFGDPIVQPALAGSTAILFYLWTATPVWSQVPDGDLNGDGFLDATDALLSARMTREDLIPNLEQEIRGDVAPLNGSSNGVIGVEDTMLIFRALQDDDLDQDTLDNSTELSIGASPFRADTDGDSLDDAAEFAAGTNPADPDTDGDGINDADEIAAGTDPLDPDTDGDGINDGDEIAAGTDPLEGVLYRHADHLGSTAILMDTNGTIIERAVYLPYGGSVDQQDASTSTPEFGYTGQRFVEAAGIYDYNARMYDPALGRFLQPDPIVPEPFNSQSLNRYSYVLNNPANLIDPTGNWEAVMRFGTTYGGNGGSNFASFSISSGSNGNYTAMLATMDGKVALYLSQYGGGFGRLGDSYLVYQFPSNKQSSGSKQSYLDSVGSGNYNQSQSRISPYDTAIDGLKRTGAEASSKNEYWGLIRRDSNGNAYATEPKLLGKHGGIMGDIPADAVGDYHNQTTKEAFSMGAPPDDYSTAESLAIDRGSWTSYMRSPEGALNVLEFRTIARPNFGGHVVEPTWSRTESVFEPYRPLGFD
jgi:RHS repeat-associated protein